MTTYPYVAARYDFGPRKATLGLCFHGAEAEAGVVGYLSRDPARRVSANFVCEASGRMVRMLPWDNTSGSMNPTDRSTNKAYYGHDHLVDVLGDYWTDPNIAVISVEIEMYARQGPNIAQVASLIAWSKDMKARYPSIRGAIGHADQTDTKGCPGTTSNMKLVFASIGGHGLWQQEEPVPLIELANLTYTSKVVPKLNVPILREPRNEGPVIRMTKAGDAFPRVGVTDTGFHVIEAQDDTIGPFTAYIARGNVNPDEPIAAPLPDCSAAVAAQRERDREAVLAAVAEALP